MQAHIPSHLTNKFLTLMGLAFCLCAFVTPLHAGFDDVYTSVKEDDGSPPKVRFDYRLSPHEKITKIAVTADGEELFPKDVAYAEDPESKTAILFLVDTSDARRAKEIATARKFITGVLDKADDKRHVFGIYPFHAGINEEFAPLGKPLKDIKASAKKLKAEGLNTMLYASTLKAIDILKKTEAKRKVIVVISDWKSEDNLMGSKDFYEKASAELKGNKIICYSVILAEEDRSEIDTAESLASSSGGYLVKVKKSAASLPKSFTAGFMDRIENGGHYVVDLAGRESSKKLTFQIKTDKDNTYTYEYDRKAKTSKDVTPPPADEPATGDEPDATPDADADPDKSGDPADEADADEEVEAKDPLAMAKKGTIMGVPIWAVLAAIAVAVIGLIVLLIFLLKGGKDEDEEFEQEFTSESFGNEGFDPNAMPAGTDPDVTMPMGVPTDAPPIPGSELSQDETEFELGNGKAVCRTMPQPGEAVMAKLLFGEGGQRGSYPIGKTAIRIGRGSDNDLSFNNDSVSRHHAEILSKRDGSFSITDLDSGNGVFVNGQEVTQQIINHGDTIEVGEITFTFSTQV